MAIPFNRPYAVGNELRYISEALAAGHLSGDGAFTKRCSRWLESQTQTSKALLTHSCTAALEMSALLIAAGPGDEIIMPSYTFVSTANAFVLRGAVPVFVDIDPETLNIDPELVAAAVTSRTIAIVAVHYAGVACDMDALARIAEQHDLFLIEDAAQALMASYKGRPLGSCGHLGTVSFHETKSIISGEGGALLINDRKFLERADIIRDKGTNRTTFLRGEVDKYHWLDVGSSYLPSEMIAAFLWAQLEMADELTRSRLRLWNRYNAAFESLERDGLVRRPVVPDYAGHNGHLFYLIAASAGARTEILTELAAQGIGAIFHYVPLHSSPAGMRWGRTAGSLRHTEDLSRRLFRLPLWHDLTDTMSDEVIAAVYATRESIAAIS